MSGKSDSLKTIFYALGANFAIFVSKLVAALMTGSGAMMAEAVHSLADCANQGLLLIGMRNAKRAPSAEHPLGFGKAIYFWSFLVALLLFSVGGTFSFYEGMHKLDHPEPLRSPWIAVGVLVFGLIAEAFSMWGCMREVNKARGETNLWRWVRTSRQSELIVVFGEDLAALVGLAIALAAVVATMLTGNPVYDAMGSIAIGALLGLIAVFLARQVSKLLVGKSAEAGVREAIADFVRSQPEVEQVFNQITLQLGPDIMVATKAKMRGDLSGREQVEAINRVEAAMKAQFPEIRWSFFEPDIED
ncbi:MAG TPA: cation diffusion facilitator family transporter [Rudaea sp.]|nr:cation diffusion facilitator family transporter [Rudaea sp.]HSC10348.1 cation diffusion facilitator family transporter [Rhodanobacteraceae bacterium]